MRDFMGVTVRQKVKGKGQPWWVFVAHDGKRKSMKVGDKTAACQVASAFRQKLKVGELQLNVKKTHEPIFEEYSEKWLAYIKTTRKTSTHERYLQVLDSHVLPMFKGRQLNQITRGEIRDFFISKMGEGLSRSSVCIYRDVISGVFNYAIDEETVQVNPALGVTKRLDLNRKEKSVYLDDILTTEEVELFLDTCSKHNPEFYPFFLMACRAGLRLGELLAIRWGDIDFNSNALWVRQSYRRGVFTAPKNGKSRKVDMSPQLGGQLKVLLTEEKKKALKAGSGDIPELIFHRNGRVVEQNYIRRVFKRLLKTAGLREIRLHALRHTFASLLLSMGESPVYVKEQMGHSSIQITVDIYGHWIQTKKEAGVNRLDSLTPACTLYAPKSLKSYLSA